MIIGRKTVSFSLLRSKKNAEASQSTNDTVWLLMFCQTRDVVESLISVIFSRHHQEQE
jgi:hypothetical protein